MPTTHPSPKPGPVRRKGPNIIQIVVDDMGCFFDHPGEFLIIQNWTQLGRGVGNSSVFRWQAGRYGELYERFRSNPAACMSQWPNSQTFVSKNVGEKSYWPERWCRSFKEELRPRFPMNFLKRPIPSWKMSPPASLFHGKPNPPEALRPGPLHPKKFWLPAPWVADHWHL